MMADKKNFAEYLTDDNLIFIENEYIKLAFDEAGIHIPYNQLDVHVKNEQ